MGVFAAVRAYAIRPYIFTIYLLGMQSWLLWWIIRQQL